MKARVEEWKNNAGHHMSSHPWWTAMLALVLGLGLASLIAWFSYGYVVMANADLDNQLASIQMRVKQLEEDAVNKVPKKDLDQAVAESDKLRKTSQDKDREIGALRQQLAEANKANNQLKAAMKSALAKKAGPVQIRTSHKPKTTPKPVVRYVVIPSDVSASQAARFVYPEANDAEKLWVGMEVFAKRPVNAKCVLAGKRPVPSLRVARRLTQQWIRQNMARCDRCGSHLTKTLKVTLLSIDHREPTFSEDVYQSLLGLRQADNHFAGDQVTSGTSVISLEQPWIWRNPWEQRSDNGGKVLAWSTRHVSWGNVIATPSAGEAFLRLWPEAIASRDKSSFGLGNTGPPRGIV